jgi:endonuclease YncB( thermonuclease family)
MFYGAIFQLSKRMAYVFEDGENLNLDLVRQGLSPYYTKYGKGKKYDAEFRAAEKQAWKEKRNIL